MTFVFKCGGVCIKIHSFLSCTISKSNLENYSKLLNIKLSAYKEAVKIYLVYSIDICIL